MKIEILNRFNDNVIFTHDAYNNSLHKTITTALAAKINLSYANLSGANLSGEILTKTPLTITNLRWWVLISEQYMRIGCQRHTHAEWANFTHDEINAMDENAASFWAEWKTPLLAMCNAHGGKNSIKEVTNNG